ncbi:MAG: hypothetical protein FJ319_02105 [SAR202 cluster bacterium]|nr:hypothetical protein [SAR202 cluster bacterium]
MKRTVGFLAYLAALGSAIMVGCAGGTPAAETAGSSAISGLPTPSRALSQAAPAAEPTAAAPAAPADRQQGMEQILAQIQARVDAGEITAAQAAELRQRLEAGGPGGPGGRGGAFVKRGGAIGTLVAIDGSTLTINGQQGEVKATIGADTVITISATSTASALKVGSTVMVAGQRDADNVYTAFSFTEIPQDGGPLGGLAQRFQGQEGGTTAPQQQGQAGGFFLGGQAGGQLGGQIDPRTRQQLFQQFQQGGGFQGQGGGPQAQAQAKRLTGTVDKIEGEVVTVNTAQGPLRVNITADTFVNWTRAGTIAELKVGEPVIVNGQPGAGGVIAATSVSTGQQAFGGVRGGIQGQAGGGGLRGQGGIPPVPAGTVQ